MPGDLIKLINTQADWQSGSLEGLDAVSTPGLVIPTGDYSKVYDSQADWDTGSKSNVVSSAANEIGLATIAQNWKNAVLTASSTFDIYDPGLVMDGDTGTAWLADTNSNEWLMWDYGETKAEVTKFRIYDSGAVHTTVKDFRFEGSDNGSQWTTLISGTTVDGGGWQEWNVASPHKYRYYRLYGINVHGGSGSLRVYEVEFILQTEYQPSGTWTSPWLAHGIASPQSGFLSLVKEVPAGTAVTPHVRYSSDGGSTYTDWVELTNARLPGLTGTHVQVRLTLTTDDPPSTPVVSKATLLVGSMHRWTSPAIDLAGVEEDATLMLPTSQTELDVVREIREYPNFTFNRSSTAYNPETGAEVAADTPRYVTGEFGQALYVEEGTDNVLSAEDASFEGGTVGNWAPILATRTVVSTAWHGTNGLQVVPSAASGRVQIRVDSGGLNLVALNDTITLSAYAKLASGGPANVTIGIAVAGVVANNQTFSVTSTGWTRISVTQALTSLGSGVYAQLYAGEAGVSYTTVIFDGIQLEKKAYPTSWYLGTREVESLTIPTAGVCTPDNFHLEFWAYINSATRRKIVGNESVLFHLPRSTGNHLGIRLYHSGTEDSWVIHSNDDVGGTTPYTFADSCTPDGWHYFIVDADPTELRVRVDGNEVVSADDHVLPAEAQGMLYLGYLGISTTLYFSNTYHDDLRISSRARTNQEGIDAYQSNQPLPVDEHTTYKMACDGSWKSVGMVFPRPAWQALQARLTLTKTGTEEQSLDNMALWESVALKMRGRPRVTLSPPEITHVKVYVEDSEPLVEYTASLDVRADQRVDHPPIAVPAGSNEAYCQQVAEAVLAAKSKERVSLQCVVPLVTRLRFGELVPVVLPYMGYTRDEPYMARVQRMEHDVLRGITTLALGDFLPEDEEALVRLLKGGK